MNRREFFAKLGSGALAAPAIAVMATAPPVEPQPVKNAVNNFHIVLGGTAEKETIESVFAALNALYKS